MAAEVARRLSGASRAPIAGQRDGVIKTVTSWLGLTSSTAETAEVRWWPADGVATTGNVFVIMWYHISGVRPFMRGWLVTLVADSFAGYVCVLMTSVT